MSQKQGKGCELLLIRNILFILQYYLLTTKSKNLIQIQKFIITVMHPHRKNNRLALHPFSQNIHSTDLNNKHTAKGHLENIQENYLNTQSREFIEDNELLPRRSKTDEFFGNFSIPELNMELDKNLDDIISLLNRRKSLMAVKKKRIFESAEERLMKVRNSSENNMEFNNDEDFIKITNFCSSTRAAVKMLGKIVQTIPQMKGPRIDEQQRSQQFWAKNRKLQNDIDAILEKLKTIDKQLQKQNVDVLQICRELDKIEDTLKSFVGAKSVQQMQKVQPLFLSKKKYYDVLNRKIKDRQISKDKKIQYIKRITNILDQLKRTREERLEEIALFFGIDSSLEFDKMNINEQGDFGNGIEELLKTRQRGSQLEISEKEVLVQLQMLAQDQDRIANQLMKVLSDQAKAFHNFNNIQNLRIKYASILRMFQKETNGFSFDNIDTKEYIKKFKEVKGFFKRFLEEDTLLKQGLTKTSQTAKTFQTMLRVTESQKERRQDLLGLLEACIRKRGQYQQKKDELRNIQFQESRNQQQLLKFEEDLEAVLTDGDLQGYKNIGNAIHLCEKQKIRLAQLKDMVQKQMESMDRDMVSIANRIQEEYDDILSDVLPSDFEYSLKSGEDVKKLRNQLRRMYKRLGLLSSQ